MFGGTGADRSYFDSPTESGIGSGIDKIKDFSAAQADRIALFNDSFVWTGMAIPEVAQTGNLSGQYGAATVYNPETVRVYGDVNCDNLADFAIDAQHVTTLDASAFIL